MKKCSRCGIDKEFVLLNFKNKSVGERDVACKECTRKSIREHYIKNRSYYLVKVGKRNKEIRISNKKFLHSFLTTHPCVDCGESDPIVLEFDHFEDKKDSVARL